MKFRSKRQAMRPIFLQTDPGSPVPVLLLMPDIPLLNPSQRALNLCNSQTLWYNVPDYLLTDKNYTKIKDKRITQFFDNNDSLEIGVETKVHNGTEIRIFNRERMIVELIRNKSKFSFDYYKEIIANYRKLIYELDIQAVQEYACQLPKTRLVLDTLQLEVF